MQGPQISVSVAFSERRASNITSLEVRFKHYGLKSVEVVDNGSGISESDYENIGPLRSLAPFAMFNMFNSPQAPYFKARSFLRPYLYANLWIPWRGFVITVRDERTSYCDHSNFGYKPAWCLS
jgi:hypothetical protein